MTALLQPLDTHVFARFKLFLRTRLHQFMLSGRNRDLLVEEVLDALMHAMKGVLQRNAWASAFANNGFGPGFQVRPHLLEKSLEWTSQPVIAADLPSLAQFQSCFPANRYIPFMGLLSGLVPRPEGPPKRERAPAGDTAVHDGEAEPWRKRLRPRIAGRVVRAKAKAEAPTMGSSLPPPESAVAVAMGSSVSPLESAVGQPEVVYTSAGGHVLHSLRPLPKRLGRSSSRLLDGS